LESKEIIDEIVELEWTMFHGVNGSQRVSCQEDRPTFEAMRRSQFAAWSREAAESYLRDVKAAGAAGRNLAREKYIRMMESTDPEGFEAFRGELPPLSPAQESLSAEIWARMLAQTQRMREKYPAVALSGRPLLASEERDGWASLETYQTGELKTYSEQTLRLLLAHLEALEARGIDLAFEIQKNSVAALGYRSMEEAERAIAFRIIRQFGGGECTQCGCYEDRCNL